MKEGEKLPNCAFMWIQFPQELLAANSKSLVFASLATPPCISVEATSYTESMGLRYLVELLCDDEISHIIDETCHASSSHNCSMTPVFVSLGVCSSTNIHFWAQPIIPGVINSDSTVTPTRMEDVSRWMALRPIAMDSKTKATSLI